MLHILAILLPVGLVLAVLYGIAAMVSAISVMPY
jgi:hypothetical protein